MLDGAEGRITVVGGGAIGGSIAASLALAGEEITLIDSSRAHVDAIRNSGLALDGIQGDRVARLSKVLTPDELSDRLDLVLLAVKSQDTRDAVEEIQPWLHDDSVIVSLQNGWNAKAIASRVGAERVIPAMVHMVAFCAQPGHVTRYANGDFYLGEMDGACSDRVVQVAKRLSVAAPMHAVDNVWGYIWSKQIYAATMPTNEVVDQPASETYAHDWVKTILLGVMFEGIQVADAEDVRLEAYERFDPAIMRVTDEDGLPAAMAALPTGSSKGNSSGWFDLKHGRKTEVEYLTGELVRLGRRHGLPMTLVGGLVDTVLEIEAGRRTMALQNLEPLRAPAQAVVAQVLKSGALRR